MISGAPAEEQLARYKGLYCSLADKVYRLPLDEYTRDFDHDHSLVPLHPEIKRDDKSPNGIVSLVKKDEKKEFIYNNLPDKPEGWRIEVPTSKDRAPSCTPDRFALYEKSFEFGFRVPLTEFQVRLTNYFRVTPAQLLPNSWRIIVAFEALCLHLYLRPTSTLFHQFYTVKGHGG